MQLPPPAAAGGVAGGGPAPAVSGARPSWQRAAAVPGRRGVVRGHRQARPLAWGAAGGSAGALASPRGDLERKEALLPFGLQGRLRAASTDILIC